MFVLAGCLALVPLAWLGEKTLRERKAVAELQQALRTNINMRSFQQQPLTINKAIQMIQEECAAKGTRLPIVVDYQSFQENEDVQEFLKETEEPGLFDSEIHFPSHPKRMSAGTALRLVLAKVKVPVATYVIRPDGVIITTCSKEVREAVSRVYPGGGLVVTEEPGFWERIRQRIFGSR